MKRAVLFTGLKSGLRTVGLAFFFILGVGAFISSEALGAVPRLINFQGILRDGSGNPVANGSYSVTFRIYEVPAGGTLLWAETTSVTTANGLFAILLGASNPVPDTVFKGSERWLGIAVSPDPEMPRQRLVSVGYAYRVNSVDSASGGTITSKVSIGLGHTNTGDDAFVAGNSNTASGNYSVIGGGSFNAASGPYATVGGGANATSSAYASTVGGGVLNVASGTAAAVSGGNQNTANSDHSTVSGGFLNTASGAFEATVGGGSHNTASGTQSTVGGGAFNLAGGEAATIGGGTNNLANDTASTIGGGRNNKARGIYSIVAGGGGGDAADSNAARGDWSTVGGGKSNVAGGIYATVAGGVSNTATGGCFVGGGTFNTANGNHCVVGGGSSNSSIGFFQSTVSGGSGNSASGNFASIPGGLSNSAAGDYSFAGGRRAIANHSGAFVWGDATDADFISTATNQFLIRASGGVGIGTNSPARSLDINGDFTVGNAISGINRQVTLGTDPNAFIQLSEPGGAGTPHIDFSNDAVSDFDARIILSSDDGLAIEGANVGIGTTAPAHPLHMASGAHVTAAGVWTDVSDRNKKENFAAVNGQQILQKLEQLPITEWNYKVDNPEIKHLGPTAQDFYELFGLGTDDRSTAAMDKAGVALAAIQELYRINQRQQAEIENQKQKVKSLEEKLYQLRKEE